MNLNSLLHYVVKHPETRVSISLKQLAAEVLQNTDKKAELLCDFTSVARWVLSSHDREQIQNGKLSPYCTLYGGDLKAYGECILKFVESLEQAGVQPVFFIRGPPDTEKREEFEHYREESLQMQEQCASIEQVCAGNRHLQVAWHFSQAMSMQVQCVLRSAGVRMIACLGDSLAEMVHYSRMHGSQVVGVVSRSVELVLNVPGLKVILPDVVGRIVSDVTVKALTDETCPAVSSESFARALGLKDSQLADLAALSCGGGGSLLAELGLGYKADLETVAKWLCDQELPIPELYPQCKQLVVQIQNQFLIPVSEKKSIKPDSDESTSANAPSSPNNSDSSDTAESATPKSLTEVVKVKVEAGAMLPHLLSMVEGRFWRDSTVELASLGQPCINDLTLTLRMSLYSLMGLEKVTEYGRTNTKAFDTIPVQLKVHVTCGLSQLKAFGECTRNERLSLLFDLVGNPQRYCCRDCTNLDKCVSTACKIGSEIDDPIPGAVVVICSSLLLLFQASSILDSFSGLTYSELDALVVTCLTCVAEYPPYTHLCRPPMRAISIAMHFSHVLEQVYIVASYLDLLDELPAPASLFSSMAYVPYHVAGCSSREVQSTHFDSSNLAVVRDRFISLSNLEPVVAFQAEIVNGWKDPNLTSFLEKFSSSLEAVSTYKTQMVEKKNTVQSPAAGRGLSLSVEWSRELDLSSSVDSNASSIVKCSELSSAQDYIATEEELFFAALFDDINDDNVDDIIDSNDDVTGDDVFDDDNIFSISDCEQQLVKPEALVTATMSASESGEQSNNENQQKSGKNPNPKSVTAVLGAIPPESATQDKSAVISSQLRTSSLSAPASDPPRSNSAASLHRSAPRSPRSVPPPPRPSSEDQRELPVMAHREKILQLIHSHRVVCIEGETGCGKSTKIPQFILEDSLNSNPATPCKILVTQPRRVAVIKLAERVATERRERLGQTIGYCIGGERHRTSETSLTYCTVGYLLQSLVHYPSMILRYTHIILDEIHERSTDTDFALIIVRKLVAASDNLKVIIMSATMEGHTIANYFEQAISFTEVADPYFVGAKRYTVDQYFIDELDQLVDAKKLAWSEWQTNASSNLKQLVLQQPPENLQEALKRTPAVTPFAQNVCTELIISQANLGEQILVFLPGISEIATYYDVLNVVLEVREIKDHFLVFVMHSQVPFEDQKEVFRPPPPNKAHIILATNIAESSITLPKLRMVINFGIYRQLEYNSKRHMSQLTKKWCSQASCAQRAGRAGRVFEGVAVHLFTKRFYWVIIPEFDPPEILHAPLAKLVLQAKQIGSKMGIPLPSEFLSQAVDPPSLEQMELALQELASFGAIVSRPGCPVSEEADITLLGRFSLTLPLDIEFSRLVLYGILFGIPTDAIVIAAAASLSQDVFSLPTRMVIKEDSLFSESLKRSMRSRCYFDGGQYSDPIMVCNLFREWVDYRNRCAVEEGQLSKHTFLSSFCASRAVRWNRLLLLEHSVAEIASRVLSHVPREYYIYDDIHVLSNITCYRRGFNFTSDMEEDSGKRQRKLRLSSISLHFCDNTNTIKALLAASFAHNFMIGCRGVESSCTKEKKNSYHTLTIMSNLGYDPGETMTLKSDNTATALDVQHLVSTVLPHRYCEVQLVDHTWYIHLHPEFSNNPKTAIMRAQLGEGSKPEASCVSVGSFLTDTSVVQQKLSLDMCYFWQYSERKPSWKVANAAFTKPRHPLAVNWTRVGKEKESILVSEWRNPSGLICDLSLQCPPFLGVVSTMQGIQYRNAVSARGVTILPSLVNGKEALLMLLAFQSQSMKVDFLVSDDLIAGLVIDSCPLPLPMAQVGRIVVNDIARINKLRQAMSKVMKTGVGDGNSCLFPMEEMSTIHALLRCVLEGTPNLTKPLYQSSFPTRAGVVSLQEDEDGADSEFDFEPDDGDKEEEVTLNSFLFYPPLQCTLLDAIICQTIPLDSLEVDHLFQKKTSSEGAREEEVLASSSESVQADQLHVPVEQPENPWGDSRQPQTEKQLQPLDLEEPDHSDQSDQLLESTPPLQQVLEPEQMSVSHQLPPSIQLPTSMSDQLPPLHQLSMLPHHLPRSEQLHQQQQQQLLDEQGGSFQLSPLAEPFVPNNSSFDPVLTSPLVSMATHSQEGRLGKMLLQPHVHSQASLAQSQHSPPHTTIQNLQVLKMQGSPVRSVPSMSFSDEKLRGRQQLQPNIRGVINQGPALRVESCPDYHGTRRMSPPSVPTPPPPPPLPIYPYNLQPDCHGNLLSIIFHLLDKASCLPAGEGELEIQKAKLLCQRLMVIESAAQQLQLQPQLQSTLPPSPHPFAQQGQSQVEHGGGGGAGLPSPEYRPCPAPRGVRENLSPPFTAAQMLPAAACLASKAPKSGRQKNEGGGCASNGMQPKRVDANVPSADVKRENRDAVEVLAVRQLQSPKTKREDQLSSGTTCIPPADVEIERGSSVEKAPGRPLRSPTTGLVEECSEDQEGAEGVAASHTNSDSVLITMVPLNEDASSQVLGDDSKNSVQGQTEKYPRDDMESEPMEKGAAVENVDRLEAKKGCLPSEIASTEESFLLEPTSETSPTEDGTAITSLNMQSASSGGAQSLVISSSTEKPSLTDSMAPPSPTSTRDVKTEDSPVHSPPQEATLNPAGEAIPAISIQESDIDQGDTCILITKSSSVSSVKEDITNRPSPTGSPPRDSLSPITTPASPLVPAEQPKPQRHLSDPPAGGSKERPKIGYSQLAQALLSPPHHYPFPESFRPPLSLSQLAALHSSFNRPSSAFLSSPRRPSFSGQLPVPSSGSFLHRSAPAILSGVFETAHQMHPSTSFPALSSGRATRSLDFSCSIQPAQAQASALQGVCSPPNGAALARTAVIASNGLPQRSHPPPPPPPGFTPLYEGLRSPHTGPLTPCTVQASVPTPMPMPPELPATTIVPPQTAASQLYRFVNVKDLNSCVSEDGLLATPETFVTQTQAPPLPPPPSSIPSFPPPPPSRGHKQNIPVATSSSSMPPPNRSHGHASQGGRRMPAKKTSHRTQHATPLVRYRGLPPPPPPHSQHSSNPNSPLLPPPLGLGCPLPPPPSIFRYGRHGERVKVTPPPPSPHPDLMMNYTARHKLSPLITALMPDPMHLCVQNYQASGLHVQSLEYNRSMNNSNRREREKSIPSYEQYGIPGEQLMQYFCTMLATKGRDLELNLLCGPYYRDLLKCYRVCARENELLSPSFFEQYSCFTVYGEPGHFMVRLNPISKDNHMTEQQSHMTLIGPTSSASDVIVPPIGSKGVEEATIMCVGEGKTSTTENLHQPARDDTKQSEDPILIMKLSTVSLQGSVNPDVLQIVHDVLDKTFELIGECQETEEPPSSIHKKSTIVPDNEASEVPLSLSGDRTMASGADTEQGTSEPSEVSTGENWDEESEEMGTQLPPPTVSTADSAQVSELSAPIATKTDGSTEGKLDKEDEKCGEVSTEPLNVCTDTMSGVASLVKDSVKEEAPDVHVPQPVTNGDGEMEIEEEQSDTPVIASSTVSEAIQLQTEPSTMEDDDAIVEAVIGGDKTEEKQLLSSIGPLSVATVATRVSESSTVMEDGDAIIQQPVTGGGEVEERQSQTSAIPVSLTAEAILPIVESTAEDWDSIPNVVAGGGEQVEKKPTSVESSTVECWDDTVEPDNGKEEVEKDIPAESLAADNILAVESSTMEEEWVTTVEPVTGEGMEQQEGEEKQPLSSTTETAHTDVLSSKKDGSIITSTVTVGKEVKEKQPHDLVASSSTYSKEVTQLTVIEDDWGAEEPEQLPLPLTTAEHEHTVTSRETTPASSSVITFDEECWVESEQLVPCVQSAPEQLATSSTQLEPEQQTPAVVFDEECWQESVVPECINVRSVECKPLKILKRGEPYKRDEPIGTEWHERKPLPPTHSRGPGRATKGSGGDGPEKSSGGGGKRRKNKKKKQGRQGQGGEGGRGRARFSPAPQHETNSTLGRAREKKDEKLSSSRDKELSSGSLRDRPSSSRNRERPYSSRDREQPYSSRERERPYSVRDSHRGQSSSSRGMCRGYDEHRQYSSERTQRSTRERESGSDRFSDSSQASKDDSNKRGFDGEGSRGGGGGGGRRRETREFHRGRNWYMGPSGRRLLYGAGWRKQEQEKMKEQQNEQSAKK